MYIITNNRYSVTAIFKRMTCSSYNSATLYNPYHIFTNLRAYLLFARSDKAILSMLVRFRVIFGQHYANRLHLGSRPLDDHLLRPSPVDIDAVYDISSELRRYSAP